MIRPKVKFTNKITVSNNVPSTNKDLKTYFNTLRCPLCNGQLDSISKLETVKLYCVSNFEEYICILNTTIYPPTFWWEEVSIYHGNNKYWIGQEYKNLDMKCSIQIRSIDKEGRVIEGSKIKSMVFKFKLFDFQSLDKNRILSKLKTILVFQ